MTSTVITRLLPLTNYISGAENETQRALLGHTNGNNERRSPSAAAMLTMVAAATIVRFPPVIPVFRFLFRLPPPPDHSSPSFKAFTTLARHPGGRYWDYFIGTLWLLCKSLLLAFYIQTGTKWRTFCRQYFQRRFLELLFFHSELH